MHRHLLDSYGHLDSPIHRRPAWLKVIAALATVVLLVVAPPSVILFASIALILFVIAAISRIPAMFLAKRLVLLEPFVLGVAVLTLFQPHGGVRFLVVDKDLESLPAQPRNISIVTITRAKPWRRPFPALSRRVRWGALVS